MSHECSLLKNGDPSVWMPSSLSGRLPLELTWGFLLPDPCLCSCCHHSTDACLLRTCIWTLLGWVLSLPLPRFCKWIYFREILTPGFAYIFLAAQNFSEHPNQKSPPSKTVCERSRLTFLWWFYDYLCGEEQKPQSSPKMTEVISSLWKALNFWVDDCSKYHRDKKNQINYSTLCWKLNILPIPQWALGCYDVLLYKQGRIYYYILQILIITSEQKIPYPLNT